MGIYQSSVPDVITEIWPIFLLFVPPSVVVGGIILWLYLYHRDL